MFDAPTNSRERGAKFRAPLISTAARGLLRLRFDAAQVSPGANLALLDSRNALDFGEGAHEVASENLQNVLLAVAASKEFVCDVRKVFNALDAFGQRDAAIEVRAEADVINPCDLRDVVNVVNEHVDGRRRERVRVFQLLQLVCKPLRVVLELSGERVTLRLQTRVALDRRCANTLVQEDRVEVDHHDAAVLPYALRQLVRYVPPVVRVDARRRVRRDD